VRTFACILQKQDCDGGVLDHDFDNLWLAYAESDLHLYHLDLNLGQYFDMFMITKGCSFWQMLFVKNAEKVIGDYEMENVTRMLIGLPHIFPNHNYSPLFKRFDKIFGERITTRLYYKEREYYQKLFSDYEAEAVKWR